MRENVPNAAESCTYLQHLSRVSPIRGSMLSNVSIVVIMSRGFMTARELQSLDNYITGHYGEDQYPDEREPDPADNIPEIVSVCEELNCDMCWDLECPHNKHEVNDND